MRIKIWIFTLCIAAATLMIPPAQAGVIRSTGEAIASKSATVGSVAASKVSPVANGAVNVGKATGGAVATGASAVANGTVTAVKGAKNAPSAIAQGTTNVAKKVWNFVW